MDKCYSVDEENYNLTEIGDVLDQLDLDGNLVVGHSYWEADAEELTPEYVITSNLESVLEQLDDRVYEDLGEVYDNDFMGASADAKAELKTLLIEWTSKHVNISRYYIVKNSVEKFITDEDIS